MVCLSPQLFLPIYLHENVGPPAPPATSLPTLVLQQPPCSESPPPQLPISSRPAGPDECFFFNSLVVGLPHSSIFCQFWLFFVFKFVVVLLLVVQGGSIYLPMPPSWLEIIKFCGDTLKIKMEWILWLWINKGFFFLASHNTRGSYSTFVSKIRRASIQ